MTLMIDGTSTSLEYRYVTDVANIPVYKHNLSDKITDTARSEALISNRERKPLLSTLSAEPQRIVF